MGLYSVGMLLACGLVIQDAIESESKDTFFRMIIVFAFIISSWVYVGFWIASESKRYREIMDNKAHAADTTRSV